MQLFRTLIWWIFLLVFVPCLFIFAAQNSQNVQLKFFAYTSPSLAIAYYMYLAFGIGVLCAAILGMIETFRVKRRLRKLRRLNDLLEREVHALRNQPLYDVPSNSSSNSKPIDDTTRLSHDGIPEQAFEGDE